MEWYCMFDGRGAASALEVERHLCDGRDRRGGPMLVAAIRRAPLASALRGRGVRALQWAASAGPEPDGSNPGLRAASRATAA